MNEQKNSAYVELRNETWGVRFADGQIVEVTATQYTDPDSGRVWWAARSEWPGLRYRLAEGGDTADRAVNRLVSSGISNSDGLLGVRAIVPPAPASVACDQGYDSSFATATGKR